MLQRKTLNINYQVFEQFIQSYVQVENQGRVKSELSKETLAMICKLASSEKDRCLIKYTACAVTPNISSESAQKLYGISELKKLSSRVEDALVAAAEIERTVHKLAQIKEKSFLEQLGIANCNSSDKESSDDSSNEEAELGCDSETDDRLPEQESQFHNAQNLRAISSDRMLSILHWSAAFYKGLERIQLEDGQDKTIVNRDDDAGFRLDTSNNTNQFQRLIILSLRHGLTS